MDPAINEGEQGPPESPDSAPFRLWLFLRPQILQTLAPFASSLAFHALIFVVLAAWILPALSQGLNLPAIEAVFTREQPQARAQLQTTLDVASSDISSRQADFAATSATTAQRHQITSAPASIPAPRQPPLMHAAVPGPSRMSDEELTSELPILMAAMPMHQHRGETRVQEAEDTATIAGSLMGDLKGMADDGDAVVVWMLDQSLSMQADMKSLALGVLDTLEQIEKDKRTNVQHYVVAFGNKVSVVQDATDKGRRVAEAIYNLPADASGIENTFQSAEWCIDNLFLSRRWLRLKPRQRLLVVWTDESGDDYLRLENTIQRCLNANVRVDIIGPSAVLGAQTGFTGWQHPADGRLYSLPVHRGPDSSFPQKLSLGYWYRGVPNSWDESFRGPFQGTSPRWHGGSNLESMLSGFSPYALTRLARQTGGRYLMYDRPGDRAPFTLEQVRSYLPDYRALGEIEFELRRQPLRQLVLAASAVTWQSSRTRRSEPLMVVRPFQGGELGQQFRGMTLPLRLREPVAEALQTARDVERALSIFANAATTQGFVPSQEYARTEDDDAPTGNASLPRRPGNDTEPEKTDLTIVDTEVNESLLEQLYKNEPSKRWRAWCDLNMGRLLSVSVRLREYLTVTNVLLNNANQLNANTNFVQLRPSPQLQGGPVSVERLRLAKKLLQRCIDENPGTPWSVMAERELRDDAGLEITQRFIPVPPPPRPSNRPPSPPQPRPVLPNL